ncbi:MAG TPA: NAD(P)-binding domain-containing protein [Rubrobacter sp.]|nr:NAD(P)-binding domain-containing protein [Rubrobacter sp.]
MRNFAFVGLGAMGAPMARCLLSAGFVLGVFDVRE